MKTLVASFVLCLAAVAAGCKSSNPAPDVFDAPHADAKVPDAVADAAPDAPPSCTSDAGCFVCTPVTTDDFLNSCTDSSCSPFDNEARLPLYNHGNLPALPN